MNGWIWFPGDFEIYHMMKQNFSREERGFDWPAYWYASGWNHKIEFSRIYELAEQTTFTAYVRGKGYIAVKRRLPDGSKQVKKYPFGQQVTCAPGKVEIEAVVAHLEGLPSVLVQGRVIASDESWLASNHLEHELPAGVSELFTRPEQDPAVFPYAHELKEPIAIEQVNGGRLLDFGYDVTAATLLTFNAEFKAVTLCYGESRTEALDVEDCYLRQNIRSSDDHGLERIGELTFATRLRAFRYIFLPGIEDDSVVVTADRQFVDFGGVSEFQSSDERLNEIWAVADRTFRACSDIFFLDGIKRDKWVWSGDAYQSYFINPYTFFNKEIVERTIVGLRGGEPFRQHLNTIVDYSLYWLISLEDYYNTFGDLRFLETVYAKMESLLDYCCRQIDERGFIYGRPGDWIYIDWAEFDKLGPLCAEQMLLARAYESVIVVRGALGKPAFDLEEKLAELKTNIERFYWDEELGGYIDSYESGSRNVTRHANIFAVLFGYAEGERVETIKRRVLLNPDIPAIHTPYFKFWELEVMAKIGEYAYVIEQIKSYWGGMLDQGATTFWEYYDPSETGPEKYAMYGDKYGKSLCHAWGASPIYLIGRYLLGVRPTAPGYASFEVAPRTELPGELTCTLPVGAGSVTIERLRERLTVTASAARGVLRLSDRVVELPPGQAVSVTLSGSYQS
ncbi:hypothetical protein QWJ34_08230 [Saccharibacillus sp. CPCC 101409]|uniref:alpha-L-rhamnosidase-related protein n=1 Tax=Saccharibacillus sp. CPCC 101409 TaxID=3058041 RepID=UPI00267185DB|nr:hypothetical protein [Saccharibacillus sp. CPCC 101409]MDO3409748.1 hypothetical protein [Saccharibacillus sp. CPCC 101409]